MKKRLTKLLVLLLALSLTVVMTACGAKTMDSEASGTLSGAEAETNVSETDSDLFTKRDLDPSYEDASTIDLSKETGTTVTIDEAGTYVLTGSYEGQVVVHVGEEDKVQLVLSGVELANDSSAAISVENADKVFVTLAEGSKNTIDVTTTDKVDGAIFSKDDLVINGSGTLTISNTGGHGIVSKDDLKVTGGTIDITAKKKGLSGKDSVRIGGGTITIEAGTEGIEGKEVYLVDGTIDITAQDDGINAADSESSADIRDTQSALLEIRGGTITVNAGGDGLDSNGSMKVSGGTTYVSGPTNGGNGAIDCDNATITGGTVIAAGAMGMDINFGSDSTQCSMLVRFDSTVSGGTEVVLKDGDGKMLLSFTPEKDYQSIVLSSPEIQTGETYTVTAGNQSQTVEMTDTLYGEGGQMGGGMGGPGGMPGGFGGHGGMPGGRPDAQSSATTTT